MFVGSDDVRPLTGRILRWVAFAFAWALALAVTTAALIGVGALGSLVSGDGQARMAELVEGISNPVGLTIPSDLRSPEPAPPAEVTATRTRPLPNPDTPSDIAANGLLTLVNKHNPIYPLDYVPAGLVMVGGSLISPAAAPSLQALLDSAEAAGVPVRNHSGFRSFETQRTIHRGNVSRVGAEMSDLFVARPGHSEHQTGLAVDLLPEWGSHPCQTTACFGDTPHAAWLNENSWRYGWILRYKPDQHEITGFWSEEWHFRYIGVDPARLYTELGHNTLEEFLGQPPARHYLP